MKFFVLISLFILTSCSEANKITELSFEEGKVTASFSNASIQSVAAIVAEKTHVIVKVYDGVGGVVDEEFDGVPLNQFLRKVFKPYNTSFVYAGIAKENIKGVFLLNEGDSVVKAQVFIPKQGASLLSKFSQHQRSSVSDTKLNDPAKNIEMQRENQKRRLTLYLNDLKQHMVVAKQEKKDFLGLQQKIKSLEVQVARLEKIPTLTERPKVNRPEGLQRYSGF